VWIVPRFIPDNWMKAFTPSDFAMTVNVVTFNVWGSNHQLDEVSTWLRNTDADLALLQDAPPLWADTGVPTLVDLYPYQIHHPLDTWAHDNVLLSKYPIIAHARYDLGHAVSDRIELDVGGHVIAVYNIHLPRPLREQQRLDGFKALLESEPPDSTIYTTTFLSINCKTAQDTARCACQVQDIEEPYTTEFKLVRVKGQWLMDAPDEQIEIEEDFLELDSLEMDELMKKDTLK